jgi:hypothetical protein
VFTEVHPPELLREGAPKFILDAAAILGITVDAVFEPLA